MAIIRRAVRRYASRANTHLARLSRRAPITVVARRTIRLRRRRRTASHRIAEPSRMALIRRAGHPNAGRACAVLTAIPRRAGIPVLAARPVWLRRVRTSLHQIARSRHVALVARRAHHHRPRAHPCLARVVRRTHIPVVARHIAQRRMPTHPGKFTATRDALIQRAWVVVIARRRRRRCRTLHHRSSTISRSSRSAIPGDSRPSIADDRPAIGIGSTATVSDTRCRHALHRAWLTHAAGHHPTSVALAIQLLRTRLPIGALRARRTAAVHVRLVSVLPTIRARRRRAGQQRRIAAPALAIRPHHAMLPISALVRARPTAVNVRLTRIQHPVGARQTRLQRRDRGDAASSSNPTHDESHRECCPAKLCHLAHDALPSSALSSHVRESQHGRPRQEAKRTAVLSIISGQESGTTSIARLRAATIGEIGNACRARKRRGISYRRWRNLRTRPPGSRSTPGAEPLAGALGWPADRKAANWSISTPAKTHRSSAGLSTRRRIRGTNRSPTQAGKTRRPPGDPSSPSTHSGNRPGSNKGRYTATGWPRGLSIPS